MAIPKPAAERLSQLARLLDQRGKCTDPISSADIEQLTGWPSHTIRKDISCLEGADAISTSSGYDGARLAAAIRKNLDLATQAHKCCVVGLGRIGSSFLEYSEFKDSSFELCAGFDSNVNRIEILKAEFPLYPTFKMKDIIKRYGIAFAILCVPATQAQATTDKLVECGIIGIINFTPVILSVPHGVEIENVSVIDALGSLAARLAAKKSAN